MKQLASILTGLSSLTMAFTAVSYDNQTQIVSRWTSNRPGIEAQVPDDTIMKVNEVQIDMQTYRS